MSQTFPQANTLLQTINEFQPISLSEMDTVKLLNRQDTKYVLTKEKLIRVLQDIQSDYKVLDIENVRLNTYETLYFDSQKLTAYLLHHNGRANRYKVRYRKYKESALSFFEVKFKSNKNRTIKNRIVKPDISLQLDEQDQQHLLEHSTLDPNKLAPLLWVYFKRITFVSKDMKERMTIDIDLQFQDPASKETQEKLDIVIVEVKQERFTRNSAIIQTLHRHKSYPLKVSKYCLGIISCFGKEVKTNYFKKKLIKIAKITDNDFYRLLTAS